MRCPERQQFFPSEQGRHYRVDDGEWWPLTRERDPKNPILK
jgi:hypothetical protein